MVFLLDWRQNLSNKERKYTVAGSTSYGPFLLLATTLHAFPVGWVLLHEPHTQNNSVDSTQSFSVTFLPAQEDMSLIPQHSKQAPSTVETTEIKSQNSGKDDNLHSKEDHHQLPSISSRSSESLSSPSFTKKEQASHSEQREGQEEMMTIVPSEGNPEPIYPIEARENKIEGTVWLRLTLLPSGAVLHVEAIPPYTSPVLQDVALQTAKKWRFLIKNGDKKRSIVRDIPIDFKLD